MPTFFNPSNCSIILHGPQGQPTLLSSKQIIELPDYYLRYVKRGYIRQLAANKASPNQILNSIPKRSLPNPIKSKPPTTIAPVSPTVVVATSRPIVDRKTTLTTAPPVPRWPEFQSGKILHYNNFPAPDYLNDMIFHGGRSLFGANYVAYCDAKYMYNDFIGLNDLYGRGFTVYGKLPRLKEIEREIDEKIASKYYDVIIIGSVFRYRHKLDFIRSIYPKNRIVVLDGEDETHIFHEYTNDTLYFKRELATDHANVLPVSFSVPKELFIDFIPEKEQMMSDTQPAGPGSYIHNTEVSYYKNYQKSYYGLTKKKAGWDCCRHYEIIMNYCMPQFYDLQWCPPTTMVHFPKQQILEYAQHTEFDKNRYYDTMANIFEYSKEHLNTEAMIKYVLSKTDL
jgi:hypothetical protein